MSNKKAILILSFFVIIVVSFEASILTKIALWHDEAFSALLSVSSFKEMIYRTGLDVHPPFYYILLKIWVMIFSNSLFSLRFFSLFWGVLAVFIFYFFVKEFLKDNAFALVSSILLLINSFFIQFVMEARMFTLGIFLVILSSFFLLKGLFTKKRRWWFFYALTITAGIYTHYYIVFSIIAQAVFLIFYIFKESWFSLKKWLENKNFRYGFFSYFLAILLFLPWLKTFLYQNSQVQESYWIPPMNIWSIPATFLKLTTGGGIDAPRFWYLMVSLIILIAFAFVYALKNIKQSTKWLVFLLVAVPFLGAGLFSLKRSVYLDRYFIFTLPFYLLLVMQALWIIKNKKIRNCLIFLAILGSLISFPVRWARLEVEKKPGMAAAASYLNQEVKPGEKIYVGSSFVYFTFKYYNKTGVQPKLYVPGSSLPHFSGTALLSPEDIIQDFNQETKKDDIVWMINTTGFGNYQPSVPNHWEKENEKGFQDVYDYQGWIVVTKYQIK